MGCVRRPRPMDSEKIAPTTRPPKRIERGRSAANARQGPRCGA